MSCPNCLFRHLSVLSVICKFCMLSLVSKMATQSWFLFDSLTCGHQCNDRSILHIYTSDIIDTFEGVKTPFSSLSEMEMICFETI